MSDTERMTDERLEEIRQWHDGAMRACPPSAGDPMYELLCEVDRLRAKYDPWLRTVVPAVSGTYDHATGSLRVTLATWLQYGPRWARGGLIQRVELTDREPRKTHPASVPDSEPSYWWLAHDTKLPDQLPHDWFPAGHNGVWFSTPEAAFAWASEAALAWAKEQPECG